MNINNECGEEEDEDKSPIQYEQSDEFGDRKSDFVTFREDIPSDSIELRFVF